MIEIDRKEVINAIQDLFINRNDVYACQQNDGRYFTEKDMLSANVIDKHLKGEKTVGTYTLDRNNQCKWIAYDFDGTDLEKEKMKAIQISKHLTDKGYENIIEFSGKKGYHVWVFFNKTDGYSAYEFGREVCNGFETNEIFPKQYELAGKGLGNLVKLPMGIHQVSKMRSSILHPTTYKPMDFLTGLNFLYTFSKRERPTIPKYVKKEIVKEIESEETKEREDMSDVTKYLIENGVMEGKRHKKEWFITADLYFSGWPENEIVEQVLKFNKNCKPPKDERLVMNHVTNLLRNPENYIENYKFLKKKSVDSALKWIMHKEEERCKINKMLGAREQIGFDQKLFNYSIAKAFVKNMHFKTIKDTGEMLCYNKDKGIYEKDGEEVIDSICGKHLGKYKTTMMMREVIAHIKSKTYIERDDINSEKSLFALKNGVFDIENMKLSDFSPKHILTIGLPVEYNKDADCPTFKKFIDEVISDNDAMNIQEFFGYCLYRDYHIHRAFMLFGSGSNGKSTLLNVLKALLGSENIISIPLQEFDTDRFASSYLYNKLANTYADLPDKALHNTGKFKMLTGNDMVSGQQKFKSAFNFTNFAKMIFSCNKIPKSHDDTDAFWRRWIIIMFNKRFEGKEKDDKLLKKLTTEEELSGIFNWAIEGLVRLLEDGDFSNYESVEKMREIYIRKSDPVHTFVMDNVIEDEEAEIAKIDLFNAYKKYALKHGLQRMTEQKFGMELKSINDITISAKRSRAHDNRWVWIGIRLKTKEEMNEKDSIDYNG